MYNFGYKNIYDWGLSPQMQLNFNTNHFREMNNRLININNIINYINNLEFRQSNFLFCM